MNILSRLFGRRASTAVNGGGAVGQRPSEAVASAPARDAFSAAAPHGHRDASQARSFRSALRPLSSVSRSRAPAASAPPAMNAAASGIATSGPTGARPAVAPLTAASLDAWVKEANPVTSVFIRRARKNFAKHLTDCATVNEQGHLLLGDLRVSTLGVNYHELDSLPPGLRVSGTLMLDHSELKTLPAGLKVGNLFLFGCPGLRGLPEGFEATGGVHLNPSKNFTRLPHAMSIAGDLLVQAPGLRQAPRHDQVGGDIVLAPASPMDARHLEAARQAEVGDYGQKTFRSFAADQWKRRAVARDAQAFEKLPMRPLEAAELADMECPITLEPLDTHARSVLWMRGTMLAGASHDDMMRWWEVHGTDPGTREPLSAEAFFRRQAPEG